MGANTKDSYRLNLEAGERGLEVATRKREIAQADGDSEAALLLNVVQFALLFNLDLSTLLEAFDEASSSWQKRLHARHMILLLFECVDDFIALLGKEFRVVLVGRPRGDELIVRLNALHHQLRDVQQRLRHFRDLRTALIAHRDHDAPRLLSLLAQIDINEVDEAAIEMLNWLTALHDLCTDAIVFQGEMHR